MQYENKYTKYMQTDQGYAQWNAASVTKSNPENSKNCSSKCANDCAQYNTTQNSSDNLTSCLQTLEHLHEASN